MRALGAVLADLADIGYDAQWVLLPASGVGAPHRRHRVFLSAHPADAPRDPGWVVDGDVEAVDVREVGPLLVTPLANLGSNGGSQHPDKRRAGGHGPTLADQVEHLLPTPVVNDMGAVRTVERWDEWTSAMKAKHGNGNGHGPSLSIEAARLAAGSGAQRWGKYAAAIHRWEALTRPAPDPTIPRGTGWRLSPRFVEWMMGQPDGWVTDPAIWAGMTDRYGRPLRADRLATAAANAQLKALGNGVVTQQAVAAILWLDRASRDNPSEPARVVVPARQPSSSTRPVRRPRMLRPSGGEE